MAESTTQASNLPSAIVQQRPLLSRLKYRVIAFALQNLLNGGSFFRDVKDYFMPPASRPDIIKTYQCRKHLPVRCAAKFCVMNRR
jgi:hypothetical protein